VVVVVIVGGGNFFLRRGVMPSSTMPASLTAIEAAQQLRVELNYLYNLLRTKRLKGRKENGEWVISTKAVEERLERVSR